MDRSKMNRNPDHERPRTQQEAVQALKARYAATPFLLVLEGYVLDRVGALSRDKQEGIAALMKKSYGGGDDWRQSVRDKLKLESSVDDYILRVWRQYQEADPQANAFAYAISFCDAFLVPKMNRSAASAQPEPPPQTP